MPDPAGGQVLQGPEAGRRFSCSFLIDLLLPLVEVREALFRTDPHRKQRTDGRKDRYKEGHRGRVIQRLSFPQWLLMRKRSETGFSKSAPDGKDEDENQSSLRHEEGMEPSFCEAACREEGSKDHELCDSVVDVMGPPSGEKGSKRRRRS